MTRPLTLRDRLPQPGDLVTTCVRIDPVTVTDVYPLVRTFRVAELAGMLIMLPHWHYIRRVDGGPVEIACEAVTA